MPLPEPSWTPSPRAYHAETSRWSSSMLRCYMRSSRLAFQRYVASQGAGAGGTGAGDDARPSSSLILGAAVNQLLLDPSGGDLRVVPVKSRSTKAYQEAESWYPDDVIVTEPEREAAGRIADAILEPATRHAEVANRLLLAGHGYAEWAHRWDEEALNALTVPCKTMVDRLAELKGLPIQVELKTSRVIRRRDFERQARKFGYAEQLYFNRLGVANATGADPDTIQCFWVVVRNEPPFEVAVYRPSFAALLAAGANVDTALQSLAERLTKPPEERYWAEPWESLDDGKIPQINPLR